MIQQAEAAKAKIFDVTGKVTKDQMNENRNLLHSVVVDEEYAVLGVHIDEMLKRKIVAGKYIEFSRLIPKDQVMLESDNRLEIVTRNGQTFFQPIAEREGIGISNIFRWDQVFRVYCNIYTEVHAHRHQRCYSIVILSIMQTNYSYGRMSTPMILTSGYICQSTQNGAGVSFFNKHGH